MTERAPSILHRGRVLRIAIGSFCAFSTASSIYAKTDAVISDPAYAHESRLVDIDHGRRLNLYCVGKGSPVVVFDAGLGNWSQMWGLVQPAIAKRTQACAYDRAGLGFSDPANRESSSANIVDDLHRLLQGASINPPFVLVGHSYGGMSMRLYADLYFADVAGMVLVDPSTRDLSPPRDALPLGAAVKMAQDDGVTEGLAQACISAAETGFVKDSTIYRECVSEGSNPRYSDDINAVYIRLEQTPGFWKPWMSEKIAIDSSSADQVRSARRDYGSLPLVVLTQSEAIGPDPKEDRWVKAHDEIASLSTVGVNRIVPDASHMIMLDQPQAVIDAVDDVLDQIEHRSASDRLTR